MRYFLPYSELLWKQFPASLPAIKTAGFDGIECHLIGKLLSAKRVRELQQEAQALGLAVRFHQGWSWETGQRNLYNRILRPLGQLVPAGASLEEQVENAGTEPVVVYGNHLTSPTKEHYVYQTASEHVHGKEYVMSYERFVTLVRQHVASVVFDTQHANEWLRNEQNVAHLPADSSKLLATTLGMWELIGKQVSEIHLNDFTPSLGASCGRNVFLGEGVFPLIEFCAFLRQVGWDGILTPEVAPQHLSVPGRLTQLREVVGELVEGR